MSITRYSHRRGVVFLLFVTLAVLAVSLGVSVTTQRTSALHSQTKKTARSLPGKKHLSQVPTNLSSLSVLSRLQISETRRCEGNLRNCQVSVACGSSTGQRATCRCRPDFYFKDGECQTCSVCGSMQYVAAHCNTHQDTICIDVSFPIGSLPMNKFSLPDNGTVMSVSHSSNVFLERLTNMDTLETAMYVTNNQQSLDFVWPRVSGLEIAVSITDVYLVPDYHDVEAVDDTALFHRLLEPSQKSKSKYSHVQSHYCRHPIPDYYSLQLEVLANRTSAAQVVRCDSHDDTVPKCPDQYKDGDRYLMWNINMQCPNLKSMKLSPLKGGPNSIVCTEETDVLRKVFQISRPTTQEYMFPSIDCEAHRRQCELCLTSKTCASDDSTRFDIANTEDRLCCGISCYSETSCKKAFSSDCPQPTVECANGEVNIFSLFPHFDSMERQFACHVKYVPPDHLYSISYIINIPSINFSAASQHFTVTTNSRSEHERRFSKFDFISALHDTRLKVEDELILIGDHNELKQFHASLMKPYTIRELKSSTDFNKQKAFTKSYGSKSAFVQFERPFIYSSFSWYRDGCEKNVSQIYPNQTIYKDDFTPVLARRNVQELDQSKALYKDRAYTYQLSHRDRAPYVKFFVEKGRSVLQHLQGTAVKGKLVRDSLSGGVVWHHETSTWELVFSATQDECPSVISLKIFTHLMTRCAGHFDLLINCPINFTVTFKFLSDVSDVPDVFVLNINDSATSHILVLSSVYSPVLVDEVTPTGLLKKAYSGNEKNSFVNIWLLIIIIIILTIILLIINFICYKLLNKRTKITDPVAKENSDKEMMTFDNLGNTVNKSVTTSELSPRSRSSLFLFVMLYTIYSFVFTFSTAFGIIYLTQSSVWSSITNSEHLVQTLQTQVNKSLLEIQKFEETERSRLYTLYKERIKACIQHLKHENRKLLLDYERTTKKQVDAIFVKNGTLHYLFNEVQRQNLSVYLKQIQEFVSECNKTLNSIVDRFQANYYLFIRNTALSDWLKFPRQIFLHQDGEDPDLKYLSSTHVRQFAYWLEIDKTEELFAVKENVFGRLSSIPVPQIQSSDVTFPSLHEHLVFKLPEFDMDESSYFYTALSPSLSEENMNLISTENTKTEMRSNKDSKIFELNRDLQNNQIGHIVPYIPEINHRIKRGIINPSHDNHVRYQAHDDGSGDSDDFTLTDVDLENIPVESLASNMQASRTSSDMQASHTSSDMQASHTSSDMQASHTSSDMQASHTSSDMQASHTSSAEALLSSSEHRSQSTNDHKFYILISVFIIFDVVLWVYRVSWLRSQVYAVQHGYVDRVATDEACKQMLEIHSAYHLPVFDSFCAQSSGQCSDVRDTMHMSGSEPNIIFLKDMSASGCRGDALQNILNEKTRRTEDHMLIRLQACYLTSCLSDLRRVLKEIFLSQVVWQGSITSLAIIIICMSVHCVEFWLTPANLLTLVGERSAAADVKWHLDISNHYLQGVATQLTSELQHMRNLCNSEVDILTDVFFATVNMQTSMFTTILQGLCHKAKGKNCDKVVAHQSSGGRIVGCNFLPVRAEELHDFSRAHVEANVTREITPVINLTHHLLTVTASVVVSLLCCRLVCRTVASTVRYFLLTTNRWPCVRVYLSERAHMSAAAADSSTMQRSQSWVDSCESGVYLGEVDEANKEENR